MLFIMQALGNTDVYATMSWLLKMGTIPQKPNRYSTYH